MTERQIKRLRIGSIITNRMQNPLEVTAIRNNIFYELRWIRDDNSLSAGCWLAVPSHLKDCKLIKF